MKIFNFLSNWGIFNNSNADKQAPILVTKQQRWKEKIDDTGIFVYDREGFTMKTDDNISYIKWSEIKRIEAYKVDLLTTDEICLDISLTDKQITITEETRGWFQFIERMKRQLPLVDKDWELSIVRSPFEYDLTTIYERRVNDSLI